jgi:hypothetical protein
MNASITQNLDANSANQSLVQISQDNFHAMKALVLDGFKTEKIEDVMNLPDNI